MFLPYKDDNPSRSFPFVTVAIIALCSIAYFFQTGETTATYAFVPNHLIHPSYWLRAVETLITSMFLHGDIFHLLFNMLFLWIFGDNVEDRMGHLRYAGFYLAAGAFAGLCQAFIGMFAKIHVIGASGAIAGVMGAYYVMFPKARVRTLVLVFPVVLPAAFFLGLWFVLQIVSSLTGGSGVAWYAHIGGFLAGYFTAKRRGKS